MENNKNIVKVYTTSSGAELSISVPDTKQVISATNNKAQYFAELAKKYRDEAKQHRDDAQYYAEQNSDVSFEYINGIKSALELQIASKQTRGDYALKEEIPINISELINDADYVNKTELAEAIPPNEIPSQEGYSDSFLYTDGEEVSWKKLNINSFTLFDTKLSDHILEGDEEKGWALQGTYVYKEAVAGSRYGYPDFYAKCLEEYNEATSTETVNGVEVKVHSNGHKFYDITDKDSIDTFFTTMSSAWFYGIDTENERIFLPRNNHFEQMTVDIDGVSQFLYICVGNTEVNKAVTDVTEITTSENDTIPLGYSTYQANGQPSVSWLKSEGQWNDGNVYATFYNEFVQKIGQDFASGKVVEYTSEYTDYDLVINQNDMTFRLPLLDGSEDLLSNKFDSLTLLSSGSNYTAPANGWIEFVKQATASQYFQFKNLTSDWFQNINGENGQYLSILAPVLKNDVFEINYNLGGATARFRFYYAQGNGSLYFKVANAVQNLELLNAGEVLDAVNKANALFLNKTLIEDKKLILDWMSPDYSNAIYTSANTFTVPTYGWLVGHCGQGTSSEGSATINGINIGKDYTDYIDIQMFVQPNDVFQINGNINQITFIPVKGVK